MRRAIPLLTATFLVLALCGMARAVVSNSIIQDDIEYYIQVDKAAYDLGENVEMLYRVTNLTDVDVTIPCSRSPEFNLWVQEDGETVWMKVQGWYWFSPGIPLSAGESTELTHDWDMIDDNDNLVALGIYDVVGVMYNEPWNDFNGRDPIPTEVAVPVTIIPEPCSLVLFTGGLFVLMRNRKR